MTTKKAAVIGYPVKHSLSPVLHGYWLKKYNIDGEYGFLEVKPEDLEETLLSLKDKGYVGCNLTIPHKESAFDIAGVLDYKAFAIGAVNTIKVNDSGLFASNTDAYGFTENIKQSYPVFDFTGGKAVVLGAGGAARAIIFGLLQENVTEIVVTNRTYSKAEELIEYVKSAAKKKKFFDQMVGWENNSILKVASWDERNEILADANLLVNTTSLGMKGQPELDISLEKLPKNALVTDIVYTPLETGLLKKARERGNFVVDGLGMLLYQAVAGFEMWFGIKPEVTDDLREHVLSHIK